MKRRAAAKRQSSEADMDMDSRATDAIDGALESEQSRATSGMSE